MEQQKYNSIEEDKIDLRELWKIIIKGKTILIVGTTLFVLLSLIYVLTVKPLFQVTTVIEVAQIAGNPIENIHDTQQKLNFIFLTSKQENSTEAYIDSIVTPKDTSVVLQVKAYAYNNDSAIALLNKLINSVKSDLSLSIDGYIHLRTEALQLIDKDLNTSDNTVQSIVQKRKLYEERLFYIEKDNAALAGIYAIELGKMQIELTNLYQNISHLQNKKNDLLFSISSSNIKRTVVIGKMAISEQAIKPNKKLIITVAFITGVILSLFFIFFLEFIQGKKEETP